MLRGSHFCPNCGRRASRAPSGASEETVVEPAPSSRDGEPSQRRDTAIAAADETCPRCGARARAATSATASTAACGCPSSPAGSPSLRRRWIRRFGWYPGDWIWVSLLDAASSRPRARQPRSSSATGSASAGSTWSRRPPLVAVTTRRRCRPHAPRARSTRRPSPRRRSRRVAARERPVHLAARTRTAGRSCSSRIRRRTARDAARRPPTRRPRRASHRSASSTRPATRASSPATTSSSPAIYGSKADADAAVATARQAGFGRRLFPADRPLSGAEV